LSKLNVYLAGPIAGRTVDQANEWRDKANAVLNVYYNTVSPLRNYEHPDPKKPISQTDGNVKNFVSRDLFDVRSADIVLCNLIGAARTSLGTLFELGYAAAMGKPIALIIEPEGNPNDGPFTRECASWVFTDLDEALVYLSHIASPYVDG
jgi:nucleoside 2-deoxyribosyltransferase